MRPRVLLIAAHIDLRARIARALQSSGCAVELASDAGRALKLVSDRHFTAVIVVSGSTGIGLPEMLALRDIVQRLILLVERADEVAHQQRSQPEIETIHFNKSNERAVIDRIGEMLKRTTDHGEGAPAASMLRMDGGTLDLAGYRFIAAEGREVTLSRAETDLLRELAQNPLQTLSREQLRRAVARRGATHFEQNGEPFDRSIDMLVARVRRKIEPDPKTPRFLVTVPGVGYKLIVPQENVDSAKTAATLSEPERRHITALCCGLVGAMNFAISLDPEDLSKLTKSFQDAAIAAITRRGGTIAYVTPDQILAVFGYPEAHENDAERAVDAALDALTNTRRTVSLRGEALLARVGVATGLVLAGPEQTVGGPAALATALCAAAPENAILIAANVRRLLSAAFICDKSHQKTLGGIFEPVNACLVTGRRTVGSRFRATRSKKVTRLVGREHELDQLVALWERARRGEGQVALICGEAGIGKSHLSEFFLARLAGQSHLTLRYQCSPQHSNTPFYPVISHLEHAMGFEPSDTSELKLRKLETALLQAGEMKPNDICLYAQLLSISNPQRELSPNLTPRRQKDLTMAAQIRHLQSIAAKQPLIIVLADAHWADSSTIELVNRIIPLINSARILLLIKFRPEFVPPWANEPHVTLLRLERLGRQQSLAIISAETEGKNLPRELAEQILDRADGIPLFLEELTRAVMDSQSVEDTAHQEHATDRLVTPPRCSTR
jgi:class 3 adenylate cyclase/DNA-binding response OmpR family regulator